MFHNRNYFSVKCLVFFSRDAIYYLIMNGREKKIFMMQYDFWQIAVALNLQLKIKKKSNQSAFWWNISKGFWIPIPISLANKENSKHHVCIVIFPLYFLLCIIAYKIEERKFDIKNTIMSKFVWAIKVCIIFLRDIRRSFVICSRGGGGKKKWILE